MLPLLCHKRRDVLNGYQILRAISAQHGSSQTQLHRPPRYWFARWVVVWIPLKTNLGSRYSRLPLLAAGKTARIESGWDNQSKQLVEEFASQTHSQNMLLSFLRRPA